MTLSKGIYMKKITQKLLALELVLTTIAFAGCSNKKDKPVSELVNIPHEYYNTEGSYHFIKKSNLIDKVYHSENVYIFINKEDYRTSRYLLCKEDVLGGLVSKIGIYDLVSELLLVYTDGLGTSFNMEHYRDLLQDDYVVPLNKIEDYIDVEQKDSYTLEEINDISQELSQKFKEMYSSKTRLLKQ
jgi:hypothetical protein